VERVSSATGEWYVRARLIRGNFHGICCAGAVCGGSEQLTRYRSPPVGVLRELHYHFLQQFRWEKDRPTRFGLLTVINEGALMWALVGQDGRLL